jgi:Family of unknown function (DUF6272)
MKAHELLDLRSTLLQRGVVFTYGGDLTESVLSGIGQVVKQKLALEEPDVTTMRSVFAVFVEQMQNMIRHSATTAARHENRASRGQPSHLRFGILTIGREENEYFVHAGKLIETADVERLRARLDEIRSMNKDQLKALYKAELRAARDEEKLGAGVGLVEIARRSSRAIDFEFITVDSDYTFFTLRAAIQSDQRAAR